MVKNIVFDLGNVLLNFDPILYVNTKISDREKAQKVYEVVFTGEEWPMLDRGVITEEEAINRMCGRSTENGELIRSIMHNWYQLLTPIEDNVKILEILKNKGYRLYVLSNFHLSAYENVINRYSFFKYFDGGIISCNEKLLKPEKDIYERLIKEYNINPEESIFIDDMERNIESAARLGFKTIHYKDSENLIVSLIEYNVL